MRGGGEAMRGGTAWSRTTDKGTSHGARWQMEAKRRV